MPVPSKENLSYCKSWMTAIDGFADIEQQKKFWFSLEGPEGSSYEDEYQNLMSVSRVLFQPEYAAFLSPECRELLKELVAQIKEYSTNPETHVKGCSYHGLFSDPKWMSIVNLAQKTYRALEIFRQEVIDGEEKSSR